MATGDGTRKKYMSKSVESGNCRVYPHPSLDHWKFQSRFEVVACFPSKTVVAVWT
jgi:hypothetical protein